MTIHKKHNSGKRGVVIKEHVSWSHLPENKAAKLTLLNVNEIVGPEEARTRRQDEGIHQSSFSTKSKIPFHDKKGEKRIFKKIRKIAHNIMKKIKSKSQKKA